MIHLWEARDFSHVRLHNIVKVDNGIDVIGVYKKIQPDIIILDVMLSNIEGYEICRQIRQVSHCPILFLSSKNDEVDKIRGLAIDGDNYITKPFSHKEIVYRVKAQLRRAEYNQIPLQNRSIKIGALVIEPDACRVTKNNNELELTEREFGILLYLDQNVGRVISRERLYEMD